MLGLTISLLLVWQSAALPVRPLEGAPLYAFGLTEDMVPATDYAPRPVRPEGPVELWFWQFYAVERDGFDTVASLTRVDCGAGTYQLLRHVSYRGEDFLASEAGDETRVRPVSGSTAQGLMTHVCDPDPDREIRRYTSRLTARRTFDDFFVSR